MITTDKIWPGLFLISEKNDTLLVLFLLYIVRGKKENRLENWTQQGSDDI